MQGFFAFVKSMGAPRLAAMGAVTLALVGFFAFLMIRMTTPQMVPLFTDLALDDSASIAKDLDRQAVAYQLKNDGAIILVPKEQVARLRMKLAEDGLPKGGGVGYEIFDKSDALGATTFIQNINKLRALEGELSRTIRTIDGVDAARVHLVLPDRPLFSRDKIEASASIVLKVRGRLAATQVRAIRHLVAGAVNGLKPDRISVVDETGRLLADGAGSDNPFAAGNGDERQLAYENRLRQQVESIVDSVVGPGHARVQVNAEFDLNRITETSDKYDPDSRVVRSSQTREETSSSGGNGGPVSVSNELPGTGADNSNANGGSRTGDHKTEETVNYEISRTTKTEVTEAGRLKRVSAAVLVDGIYSKDAKGNMVYQPRSKDEIDRIAALVRTAIGFDAKRGDQIEVANLRFAEPTPQPIDTPTGWMSYFHFTKDDIMSGAEMGVMALLGILVMFMVVRPLVRRIVTPDESIAGRGSRGGVTLGPGGILVDARGQPLTDAQGHPIVPGSAMTVSGVGGSITAGAGPNVSLVGADEQVNISNRTSAMIDIAKVQGQVHAQSVEKVGELAEKNPHEAVSIIRNWLHEEAA